MTRVDVDLPLGARVVHVVADDEGVFVGVDTDGRFEVTFDEDPPGTIDKVNPDLLRRVEW